ncbi:MAG: DNA polymerase I [Candidatus Omnitrophota bacterium]
MKKNPKSGPEAVSKSSRLVLVDGMSFCYRAYYAIRNLSNSKGQPTNAIYGFVTMIHKLIEETRPEAFAICFDRREPTFRHERFKEYKAHRKPMPEDLGAQIEPIKAFCRASNYAMFELAGYEADDLIGTLAVQAAKKGFEVLIVTGDKDAFQLVNEKVKILNPHKDNFIYDASEVRKRFDGVGPEQVVDLMALMGDASDNIPGVRGIGEVTALKLIQRFGTLDKLFSSLEAIDSKKQRALLAEHREDAMMSREIATIDTKVPVTIDWGALDLGEPDAETLTTFYKEYEFRNLLRETMPEKAEPVEARDYRTVRTEKELKALAADLKKAGAFSFDTETTSSDPMRAALVGMSFSWNERQGVYVPVASKEHRGEGLPVAEVLKTLGPLLADKSLKKYGQNIKYDWIVMRRAGAMVDGIVFDTMIASYLINPVKLNHNLDDISLEYLALRKITTESLIGKGKGASTMDEAPVEEVARYAAEDADCVFRLVPILSKKLQEQGLQKLFTTVEMPLSLVLAEMEMSGVSLDTDLLKELSDEAAKELEALTRGIYQEAGQEFNINSTKQLADVLFVKLKLPVVRKTKTGFSTDVNVLEKLAEEYELPKKILEYREQAKLKSTYLDALPTLVCPGTGCVHTSYHQAVTATGRLSSSDPNLQNIPSRTAAGRRIRKAFVPRPRKKGKGKIVSADYSQIELRVLAHLSGDKNLMHAFREDKDIHRFTATLLYEGVREEDVTREMRDTAKVINFSIIYGKTGYGLSKDLGIPIPEAEQFIRQYFERYEGIKKYLDQQKEKARKQGYLETILGRRSYFPEINSSNLQVRQFAERAAINAPIQGSAADLIKLAMIRIQEALRRDFAEAWMIMQVHDELVFDVPAAAAEKVAELVRREMEGAYSMKVPLKVDTVIGDSWFKP